MLSEEEKKDKYINKLLNFSDETINNAEKLVINKEQAKEIIEELKRDYIPKAIINLEMENLKKHSELTMLSAEEKKAIERMYDLIHTCEVGMEKYGKYDDLFEKDKQAIETVLNLITRLEKDKQDYLEVGKTSIANKKEIEIEILNLALDGLSYRSVKRELEQCRKFIREKGLKSEFENRMEE